MGKWEIQIIVVEYTVCSYTSSYICSIQFDMLAPKQQYVGIINYTRSYFLERKHLFFFTIQLISNLRGPLGNKQQQ